MTTHDTAAAKPVTVRAVGQGLDRPEWVERVKVAWRKGIEGIVETSRLLLLGHNGMPPDEFGLLVTREFGFSMSMARKLICIAKDERIANCAIWHKLPRAWTTVYELTKLDDPTFNAMLAEGSISASMTKLVDNPLWREKHRKGVRLKRLPKKLGKAPSKAPSSGLKAKPATPPRPLPFDTSTAKDLLAFVTKLANSMRGAPPNITLSVRLLLPEERRELAVCASDAIAWLSKVYDAAQPKRDDF